MVRNRGVAYCTRCVLDMFRVDGTCRLRILCAHCLPFPDEWVYVSQYVPRKSRARFFSEVRSFFPDPFFTLENFFSCSQLLPVGIGGGGCRKFLIKLLNRPI